MTNEAIVLYEDSRAVAPRSFAPHDLVLACVADRVNKRLWDIRHAIQAVPVNGVGNLKGRLGRGVGAHGERVFAVFDRDRISEPGAFPGCGSCLAGIRRAIARHVAPAMVARFTPILLEKNMETVVNACCKAAGKTLPHGKPSPTERDRLIAAVAYHDGASRREVVLEAVPSLAYLVAKLEPLVV